MPRIGPTPPSKGSSSSGSVGGFFFEWLTFAAFKQNAGPSSPLWRLSLEEARVARQARGVHQLFGTTMISTTGDL
jgi:hypothetical protein